jgi:CheY-like chemotaxis protein
VPVLINYSGFKRAIDSAWLNVGTHGLFPPFLGESTLKVPVFYTGFVNSCTLIMATSSERPYKRLLIIDDDIEDQEIFIEAVRDVDQSIECQTALSGENAFTRFQSPLATMPDLIFLDMNMPKLNGKQVLREIKNHQRFSSVPVIMYSTSFAPSDIEEIKQLGAVYHLLKPSRFDDLCNALKHLLAVDWLKKN